MRGDSDSRFRRCSFGLPPGERASVVPMLVRQLGSLWLLPPAAEHCSPRDTQAERETWLTLTYSTRLIGLGA
jgi:hypothetical protein